MAGNPKKHWENVYSTKDRDQVSWYQPACDTSLKMIEESKISDISPIIDVGSGTSLLPESLLLKDYINITVLDISEAALLKAKNYIGEKADHIKWVVANVLDWEPKEHYDLWHDRAVFHFLTNPDDRKTYLNTLRKALNKGGTLIISSFGPEGPEKCSGLPVRRYSPELLDEELGPDFKRLDSILEIHETPWGSKQQFLYCSYTFTRNDKNP